MLAIKLAWTRKILASWNIADSLARQIDAFEQWTQNAHCLSSIFTYSHIYPATDLMSSLDRQTAWFGSEAYRNLPSPSCKIRNTPKDLLDISAVFKESGETLQAVDAIM